MIIPLYDDTRGFWLDTAICDDATYALYAHCIVGTWTGTNDEVRQLIRVASMHNTEVCIDGVIHTVASFDDMLEDRAYKKETGL